MEKIILTILAFALAGCMNAHVERPDHRIGAYKMYETRPGVLEMRDCEGGFSKLFDHAEAITEIEIRDLRVEVTGLATSACTIFLDNLEFLAPNRVCVHPTAQLQFHSQRHIDTPVDAPVSEVDKRATLEEYRLPYLRAWFEINVFPIARHNTIVEMRPEIASAIFGAC